MYRAAHALFLSPSVCHSRCDMVPYGDEYVLCIWYALLYAYHGDIINIHWQMLFLIPTWYAGAP